MAGYIPTLDIKAKNFDLNGYTPTLDTKAKLILKLEVWNGMKPSKQDNKNCYNKVRQIWQKPNKKVQQKKKSLTKMVKAHQKFKKKKE